MSDTPKTAAEVQAMLDEIGAREASEAGFTCSPTNSPNSDNVIEISVGALEEVKKNAKAEGSRAGLSEGIKRFGGARDKINQAAALLKLASAVPLEVDYNDEYNESPYVSGQYDLDVLLEAARDALK